MSKIKVYINEDDIYFLELELSLTKEGFPYANEYKLEEALVREYIEVQKRYEELREKVQNALGHE